MTRTVLFSLAVTLLGLAPGLRADDDGRRPDALSVSNALATEEGCGPAAPAVFTVTLSRPHGPVTVQYATADGTAVAGADYTAVSGTLTFDRDVLSQTVQVPVADVLIPGPDKTLLLNLSRPFRAVISNGQGVGTIRAPKVAKCQSCGVSCNKGDACFTDSCDAVRGCQHVNSSATDTPYCTLAGANGPPDPNFAACNASGQWIDSDGDGFSDAEEIQGYIDVNGNGVYEAGIDVPLPGADPHKPDVYIHYDYFYVSDHDHNPSPEAIQWMVDAFAAQGINLHIDPQHNAINESTGKVVTDRYATNPDPACVGPSAVTMHELRQTYFPPNFFLAYHYLVFSHWSECDSPIDCDRCAADPECGGGFPPPANLLGHAEIFGDNAIVSFGVFVDAGVPIPLEAEAGITMHELGHNFGLFHGGGSCDNYKPNYLSVMNGDHTSAGITVAATPGSTTPISCTTDADCPTPHPSGAHCSPTAHTCVRIDYSDRQCNDLNECVPNGHGGCLPNGSTGTTGGLDETVGLQCASDDTDISTFNVDGITPIPAPTNGAPIDWNQDTTIETHVSQDINGDGATTLLTGYNDWQNLRFNYQCSTNYDPSSQAAAKLPFEQLFQRYWLAAARSQPVTSSASNTIVQFAGAASPRPTRKATPVDWLKEHSLLSRR